MEINHCTIHESNLSPYCSRALDVAVRRHIKYEATNGISVVVSGSHIHGMEMFDESHV
jgi:hypothetical protein